MTENTRTQTPETLCEHKYVEGRVKYRVHPGNLPGSGASAVSYYQFFFCEKCLDRKFELLPTRTNSYERIRFDAVPMTVSEAKPYKYKYEGY